MTQQDISGAGGTATIEDPKPTASTSNSTTSSTTNSTTASTTSGAAEATPAAPDALPVRSGEEPWSAEELDEVRSELEAEVERLLEQIETSNAELVGLLRDGSDGAGRDAADVGSTNYERDHEMSLANNAREMLEQSQLALRHIANGTYGICDNCGQAIGKGRLQAFPRATLCVSCKQREERR